MVVEVTQQAAGVGLGIKSTEKIGISNLAKRRRKQSAAGGRADAKTKAMLAGVVAVALVAVMCNGGGHKATHPVLRSFLEISNSAAARAIGGDVQSSCADPKRWLNSAGHDLLSELPEFRQHNASMLWGTYRPGVYFGFTTRTFPVAVTGGLMWHGGDGRAGMEALRHECSEGDGLGPYGWVEHDGESYGKQEVVDNRAGVRLVTSIVKPAQLTNHNADVDGRSDVHLASRVEVIPTGAEKKAPGSPARSSTLYFYVGLDHLAAGSDRGQEDGGLVVIDSDSRPRRSLRVRGVHPQLGGFEVAATVSRTSGTSKTGSSDEEQEGAMAAVNFLGKQNLRIGGVKDEVERLHAAHRRVRRKGDQREMAVVLPFLLPDELEAGSNVVLVQVTGQAPFSVDFVVRASTGKTEDQPSAAGEEASPPPIPSVVVSDWLTTGSRTFSDRFRETFSLEDKGFRLEDVAAAKAALSNMLGGFGYFTGRTEVRGAGLNGRSGYSFEARLFTGVPSRSFFPRGFLWDEGFHQLLVSAWDRSTSVDVLGHWLSVLHVHDEGRGEGTGCVGGWLPREQILGEEARKRVPAEFMAQDITVANPPTLLLLVDKLLRDLDHSVSDVGDADAEGVCVSGSDGHTESPPGCSEGRGEDTHEVEPTMEFLRKAYPLLDRWMRWLLVTQRPGAEGWGGQTKRAPLGAFQWRGRDPGDDRLNALTLASGLDDYPRASHPSQDQEWHIDILSWLALGCRVMHSLSAVAGADSLPYGELFDELVGGMFELHWDGEEEAFFDYGVHIADGELVDEVIMRCKNADGSTEDVGARLEDIQARKSVCARDQQHMYPLGDGRGGLLTRRRWQGGSQRPQLVQHIGYVSLFPLLLKLLPPDSQAVGSVLSQMRDSTQLWSPHGLRSLSASDPFYQVENNPGDEPYWRGHIWVNVNYLALAALHHYSQAEGPFMKEAGRIYSELRANLLRTLLGGYHSTGYFWEQYDDRSGRGLRSHPFTGWTALVVLIMAEVY